MSGKIKIKATFRKNKKDNSIECIWYEGNSLVLYTHIGQHGDASYEYYINGTVSATPEEYKDLLEEMTKIVGYDIQIMERLNK
jgi:hypothetical protein